MRWRRPSRTANALERIVCSVDEELARTKENHHFQRLPQSSPKFAGPGYVGPSEVGRGGSGPTAVTASSERPALSVGRFTHEFTKRDLIWAGFRNRWVFCCRFALRLPCGPALRPYGLRAAPPSPASPRSIQGPAPAPQVGSPPCKRARQWRLLRIYDQSHPCPRRLVGFTRYRPHPKAPR